MKQFRPTIMTVEINKIETMSLNKIKMGEQHSQKFLNNNCKSK